MPENEWKRRRQRLGIKQREAERRMGWATPNDRATSTGHGRLSLIEQGVKPRPDELRDLRILYGLERADAAID